ncbi:hypothetical protein QBC47DRAFT_376440 [Echria macrotheca]|uniref:Uncharacterized protein n=1 Tax=Echria macrotheca TaxID=438768 RepID=A0AAJ0BG06_9PEZI|nr:hypothetical protein QBC47DRAFT_376440 [Echria macrotheca]
MACASCLVSHQKKRPRKLELFKMYVSFHNYPQAPGQSPVHHIMAKFVLLPTSFIPSIASRSLRRRLMTLFWPTMKSEGRRRIKVWKKKILMNTRNQDTMPLPCLRISRLNGPRPRPQTRGKRCSARTRLEDDIESEAESEINAAIENDNDEVALDFDDDEECVVVNNKRKVVSDIDSSEQPDPDMSTSLLDNLDPNYFDRILPSRPPPEQRSGTGAIKRRRSATYSPVLATKRPRVSSATRPISASLAPCPPASETAAPQPKPHVFTTPFSVSQPLPPPPPLKDISTLPVLDSPLFLPPSKTTPKTQRSPKRRRPTRRTKKPVPREDEWVILFDINDPLPPTIIRTLQPTPSPPPCQPTRATTSRHRRSRRGHSQSTSTSTSSSHHHNTHTPKQPNEKQKERNTPVVIDTSLRRMTKLRRRVNTYLAEMSHPTMTPTLGTGTGTGTTGIGTGTGTRCIAVGWS